jgi:PAS domain S-box-containing protein
MMDGRQHPITQSMGIFVVEYIKTILLVEDEAIIALAQQTALIRRGYKVICASDGELAVKTFKDQPEIDMVLMDINLGPGMDGTQAAELILQLREIPLLFLSAHSESEVVKKTEGISSYGFVVKNAGMDVLCASINMAFKLFEARKREKETVAELQQSEERFALAMEATKDGLWDWDVDTNHVYYSIGWKTMLGYAEDEIGDTLDDWKCRIHPEDRADTLRQIERYFLGETDIYSGEHRLLCKDGSYKWVLDRGKVVAWTDDGRPRRAIGTHSDISDLKTAEKAILQAKQDWEQTFDAVPDLIAVIDANHNILRVNKSMAAHIGLTQQELPGQKCYEVMHETVAPPDYCPHMRMMRDGCMHFEKNDEMILNGVFDITVSPIHDVEGQVASCVHVLREVSERKRLETCRTMGQVVLLALQSNQAVKQALKEIIRVVKSATEVDAVGIRLQDEEDYPYFYQEGFSQDFLQRENSLMARAVDGGVCRDEHGNICLECTCGLVIAGKTDPVNPLFTKGGSCWTNDSSLVLHVPPSADPRTSPRNECIHQGFASVALIPIRAKGRIVGLLQLNDRRKGRFTLAEIETLEGVAENIGEALLRKQAEESLASSEERFRLLFEKHYDVMLVIDPEDGSIMDANHAAAEFYGYSRCELLMMTIYQINCNPNQEILDAIESATNQYKGCFIFQHRLSDGTVRSVEVHSSPISFHDKTMLFSIIRDITERQKADAALQESNERFQIIFETIPAGVSISSLEDGTLLDVNAGFKTITGYTRDETVGKSMLALRLWHNPEERNKVVNMINDRGFADNLEVELLHKDGIIKFVSIYGRVIKIKKQPLLLMYAEDISKRLQAEAERKRLEAQLQQAQKMEAIGLLAGGIAHDFNNLLTAIIGCGQMILNRIPKDAPLSQFAQMVIEAGEKAAGLTHSLLAFSRKQTLNPIPVDLCEIAAGLEKMLVRIIREDIVFRTIVYEKQLVAMADKGQIEQVIMNFVTNANDAMPHGGTLTVDVSPIDMDTKFVLAHGFGKPGHYARITVTDSGCGMSEETQQKIFEPFYTTKELGKGTGLGLSLAYGIVRQHDGYIDLSSELGSGTAFRVYLPLLLGGGIEARNIAREQPPQGGAETILLVEDDEIVRKLHRIILEDAGYTVITAKDGEDAVAQFAEHRLEIDLLLTDVIMPKLDGCSLYKEIKRMRPGVKALFTSGYTKDIVTSKGILEGGLNYLTKPVKPHELLAKVRNIFDRPEHAIGQEK